MGRQTQPIETPAMPYKVNQMMGRNGLLLLMTVALLEAGSGAALAQDIDPTISTLFELLTPDSQVSETDLMGTVTRNTVDPPSPSRDGGGGSVTFSNSNNIGAGSFQGTSGVGNVAQNSSATSLAQQMVRVNTLGSSNR